jgi:hypothetical protein
MHLLRRGLTALVAGTFLVATASAAYAGTITAPTGNPFVVPGDGAGNPVALTVTANGFTPGSLAYLEQCDGVATTSPGWSPTTNCDLGTSQAPALVDGTGTATFPANDPNRGFTPFKGESPQSLFNCLAPAAADLSNGLTNYRNCKIRVSSSNTNVTADQAFVNIQLPEAAGGSTPQGGCTGQQMLAKIRNVTTGLGLDNTSQNVKISMKAVTGGDGTCTVGTASPAVPDPKSFKVAVTGFASCDVGATSAGLPPVGKLQFSFGGGAVKLQAYARIASTDPVIGYASDVIGVHGFFAKGPLAGADVNGTLYQNPTIKDKSVGPTFGAFPAGLDVNPFDSAIIGAGCVSGTSAGTLLFNDGGGASLVPAVQAPTTITQTLVGDGPSLLQGAGFVSGASASGLSFSIY